MYKAHNFLQAVSFFQLKIIQIAIPLYISHEINNSNGSYPLQFCSFNFTERKTSSGKFSFSRIM